MTTHYPIGDRVAGNRHGHPSKHHDPELIVDVVFVNKEEENALPDKEYQLVGGREREREREGEREGGRGRERGRG